MEKTTVSYEWTCEEINLETEDIIASDFSKNLSDFASLLSNTSYHIGLVREVYHDTEGLQDRTWAYIKDGKLPEKFDDGYQTFRGEKVPQKYFKQLAKVLTTGFIARD